MIINKSGSSKTFNLKSNLFENFIKEIKNVNRNPLNNRIFELLEEKDTNALITIEPGETFYRCRIVKKSENNEIGKDEKDGFFGFGESGSFVTPARFAKDMRANYRNIPYLYIADDVNTAICEIRPRIGAQISVATIESLEKLDILDFSIDGSRDRMSRTKENLFDSISECFSKPITEDDDTLDYIPTQYIAEYVKTHLNYDGIRYSSSVGGLNNYVIFNYKKMKAIASNLVCIYDVNNAFSQIDDDKKKSNMSTHINKISLSEE